MESRYDPFNQIRYNDVCKEYIDPDTGEVIKTRQEKPVYLGRNKFFRIQRRKFYQAMAALQGNAIKTALFIVDNIHADNIFYGTYEDVRNEFGFTNKTVTTIMVSLQEHDIIKLLHPAQWMVNPSLVVCCAEEYVSLLYEKYGSLPEYRTRRPKKKKEENKNVD